MGGSYKYSGSIKLSNLALAALTVGAGVSRVIAPDTISDSIISYLLESTLYPISSDKEGFLFDKDEIISAIKNLRALGYGMGVTVKEDTIKILEYLILT